jgi:hypothetical protein
MLLGCTIIIRQVDGFQVSGMVLAYLTSSRLILFFYKKKKKVDLLLAIYDAQNLDKFLFPFFS